MLKRTTVLIALLACGTAQAGDESHFRFGIGGSRNTVDYDDYDTKFKSIGWEVFAGYEFNRYLAVEAGYTDGGKDTKEVLGVDVEYSGDAFLASFIGRLPMGESASAFARVGLMHWDAKARALGQSVKDDGDDLYYGIGLAAIVEGALMRAEYRLAKFDGGVDYSGLSLNLAWRF